MFSGYSLSGLTGPFDDIMVFGVWFDVNFDCRCSRKFQNIFTHTNNIFITSLCNPWYDIFLRVGSTFSLFFFTRNWVWELPRYSTKISLSFNQAQKDIVSPYFDGVQDVKISFLGFSSFTILGWRLLTTGWRLNYWLRPCSILGKYSNNNPLYIRQQLQLNITPGNTIPRLHSN